MGLNFLGDFKPGKSAGSWLNGPGKSAGSWLNGPGKGSIFGPPKRNNWLMSNPSGGLFGSPAPKRRARRKNGRNHERRESRSYERREHRNGNGHKNGGKVVKAIGSGLGHIARQGYEAYQTKKKEGERYGRLREKAKRYGFKNLPEDERAEYANAALSKGHKLEG
jgi:hypothetical protein